MSHGPFLRATAALALAASAACSPDPSIPVTVTPTDADRACLRDVAATTNNPDVALLESYFSEAGTEVIVGVGPDRARRQCIAYADGTTTGIMSLTNEGAL